MKILLAFLIAMGVIVTLGHAGCLHTPQIPGRPYRGCMMNGKLYPFGHIERTEDCYTCSCSEHVMSCCARFLTPARYHENCKAVFNKKLCKFDVVQKDDPSKPCSFFSVHKG